MSIRAAVDRALGQAAIGESDAAAVALARRYADDLDQAEVVSAQAVMWLAEVAECLDQRLLDRGELLLRRVERTGVLASLGPKLAAVLAELGMTPKARAELAGKVGSRREQPAAGGDPLAEYRRRRAEGKRPS